MKLGCSSLSWQTQDGKHILGRTCDMFLLPNSGPTFMPRGQEFAVNDRGDRITAKYAYAGFSMSVTNTPIFVDGINEHGLMGCLLYYPRFAHYGDYTDGKLNLNPIYFMTYMLGNFTDINDLLNNIGNINLINEKVAGGDAPVHFIISDRSSETIILEPDQTGLTIHRNTIGVMTNSPNYDWHTQNLRNYIGMQTMARPAQQLGDLTLRPFGEGTGLIGLPGDYTPPSRFVRIAYVKHLLDKPADEMAALSMMHNVLASVTIPMGLHKNADGGVEGTLYTSVMCSESLTYYISTKDNHRISAIKLGDIKDNTEIKHYNMPSSEDVNWL